MSSGKSKAKGSQQVEWSRFSLLKSDVFQDGFSGDVLLAYLINGVVANSRDALKARPATRNQAEGGTAPLVAKASLEKAQRLVETLDKAEAELQVLSKDTSKKINQLQMSLHDQEEVYQAGLDEAGGVASEIRSAFKELEAQNNRVSQIGLRFGDRLQTSASLKSKALELVSLLSHLHVFSHMQPPQLWGGSPEQEYRKLPQVFWDESTLMEAASLARKLTALTAEAHNAKQRSRMINADAADDQDTGKGQGSLNYTTWQLSGYCNWLEERVVARFDRCMSKGSLKGMADCAVIMAAYKAGKLLAQRYIMSLPIFSNNSGVPEVQPPAGTTEAHVTAALLPFNDMCDLIQLTVEQEASNMCEVFGTDGKPALELLVELVTDLHLVPALQSLLLPDSGSDNDFSEVPAARDAGRTSGSRTRGRSAAHQHHQHSDDSEEEEDHDVEHQIAAALGRGSNELQRKPSFHWKAGKKTERPEVLATRLQLLVQVKSKVQDMMCALESCCSAAAAPASFSFSPLTDRLFETYLCIYPYPELTWLDASHKMLLRHSQSGADADQVDVMLTQQAIKNNQQAISRAATLSGGHQGVAAAHVHMLFYGYGPFEEHPGSLLEQVSHHVLDGLDHSVKAADITDPGAKAQVAVQEHYAAEEAAAAAAAAEAAARLKRKGSGELAAPPAAKPPPRLTRQQAAERARQFVNARVRPVLHAVHGSAAIMGMLQAHYLGHVERHVCHYMTELSQCSEGLLQLIRAVEARAGQVLHKVVAAVIIQAEVTLLTEQKRSDFYVDATLSSPDLMSQSTTACLLVCAQLNALHKAATDSLEAANLLALLQEVATRMHSLLLNHMRQFTYNAAGAMRWKCDITDYVELIGSWDIPAGVKERLHEVQALANVLVVPPDSLMALVDAGLRLDHREALRYISLREDYLTARLEGRSLQDIFGAGMNSVDLIIHQATAAAVAASKAGN